MLYFITNSGLSDMSYEELRRIISNLSLHTVNIKSLHATRECLGQVLHLRSKKYDSYIDGCMAFAGSHILCRRCLYCKKARFVTTTENAKKFNPNLGSLDGLTPKATYSYIPIIPWLQLLCVKSMAL